MEENMIDRAGNETGSIKIADEVVATIAGLAASEVEGVAQMSGGFTAGLTEMLGKKNPGKGVRVEVTETEAIVEINIVIEFGFPIPDVAKSIQEAVKSAVEMMTGLKVTAVGVNIVGVHMKKAKPAEEEPVIEA
ncbi:MAG: Asp23/Gls24 family envelope stress response protein [Solirubrobacterales bacterium]